MPIENTVVSTETAGKKTRVKKPVLAVKLLKYLDFGFQVVQNLHSAGLLDDEGLDLAFAQIKLLSSVEDQTAFYSNFLDQSNDTAKILRKFVVAKLKPVPVKKPRTKKSAKTDTDTDTTDPVDPVANKPVKTTRVAKPKKTTRTVADADDDIIGALAQAALSREPTGREPTDCIVQQADLRPLPSDNTTDNTTEPVVDTKTKKPRKKPEPKAKVTAEPSTEVPPTELAVEVAPCREPTDCIVQQADLRPLPSDDTTDNTTEPVVDTKTKKPRKKPEPKAKVAAEPSTEVPPTELAVELAPPITTEPVVDTNTKKPRKKPEPKAKVPAEPQPTITDEQGVVGMQGETRQSPTKKPRKKPEPKAKVAAEPASTIPPQPAPTIPPHLGHATATCPPDDDIHANEIIIDQRLFLIDQHNQLYDPHSFNLIAHFNPLLKSISFIYCRGLPPPNDPPQQLLFGSNLSKLLI